MPRVAGKSTRGYLKPPGKKVAGKPEDTSEPKSLTDALKRRRMRGARASLAC
jgi:hypothetical protein